MEYINSSNLAKRAAACIADAADDKGRLEISLYHELSQLKNDTLKSAIAKLCAKIEQQ